MNERSSKFVDQIATDKLIEKKLKKVSHVPGITNDFIPGRQFDDFDESLIPDNVCTKNVGERLRIVSFPSSATSRYIENNRCYVYVYNSTNTVRGNIIIVHGLYEDNVEIYNSLIEALRCHNIAVHLMVLPFHYERKPATSEFSGEYFFSANVKRSLFALKQGVYDLQAYRNYVYKSCKQELLVSAFSMGGAIALLLAKITGGTDRYYLINPVCRLSMNVWERPLFSTIKEDYSRHGFDYARVRTFFSDYDALGSSSIPGMRDNVALAYGEYDQINEVTDYQKLADKLQLQKVFSYKAGHLNILRIPKLVKDMVGFLLS